MTNNIDKIVPPALPQPPADYDRAFMDQNSNVFRLFFNRLINVINTLLSIETGGKVLYMPYGSFYSIVDQPSVILDTPQVVLFEEKRGSSGVSIDEDNPSRIIIESSGAYHIEVVLRTTQRNIDPTDSFVDVWLKTKGVNIEYSGMQYLTPGFDIFKGNVSTLSGTFIFNANDYIEVFWAAHNPNDTPIVLSTLAPRETIAGIPSAAIAITYVSNV